MPQARLFKRSALPFKDCVTATGITQTARTITTAISQHLGGGMEIGEDVCIHWTTLYDEILFIHEGSMVVRTDQGELECHPGDIVWLPEGVTLDYDMKGRRCAYFYALFPIDWAKRNNMEEP
ncbi:AraC family ligand binding domain-containing protein [Aestuariivirga sp.]|uniref:AraC family ligand binding domain-containing protein n=1 Tax=Aestuariivirga sp. TaxID=2650926 RepID=UPI00391B24A8